MARSTQTISQGHLTMDIAEAWRKFRHGEPLTDEELTALILDCEAGIRFLENREETGGVLFKAMIDLQALRRFERYRNEP